MFSKLKLALASATSMVALAVMTGVAHASTALDGVTTQVTLAKSDLETFVTGTAVPALFGLLILGVGIALAVKYVRRGARAA